MNCACCSHEAHQGHACTRKDCYCLRSIVDHGGDLPVDNPDTWESGIMLGILELVAQREEGEVSVKTNDGRICVVKLTLRPEFPYNMIGVGRA